MQEKRETMNDLKVKSFWNERWARVKAKAPTKNCDYQFSDYGRMKSINKITGEEKLLKGSKIKSGFIQLNLRLKDGIRQGFYLHKLIADEFLEKPAGKDFVIHLDFDNYNNHFKNLQWVDQKELTAHQIKHGVYERENRKVASHVKMNESKVRLLKKRLKEGKTKRKILARSFGITETQLKRIERGENWGQVKLEEA